MIIRFLANISLLVILHLAPAFGWAEETDTSAPPAYQLHMTVSRNNVEISKPNAVVMSGVQANLISEDSDDPNNGYRMQITVQPSSHVSGGKKEAVDIEVVFYEQVNGELVLRGEPSITVYAGDSAKLTLANKETKRVAPTFDIEISATRIASSATLGQFKACGSAPNLASVFNLSTNSTSVCAASTKPSELLVSNPDPQGLTIRAID